MLCGSGFDKCAWETEEMKFAEGVAAYTEASMQRVSAPVRMNRLAADTTGQRYLCEQYPGTFSRRANEYYEIRTPCLWLACGWPVASGGSNAR